MIYTYILIHTYPLYRTTMKLSSPMKCLVADARWGGRYAHAKSKVYLLVNAIDGEALTSVVSQRCLAILAQCESGT